MNKHKMNRISDQTITKVSKTNKRKTERQQHWSYNTEPI